MGIYVNPGNQAFAEIADSNYVDKTGMIRLINERIGGPEKLICVSRPRRFGKSFATKMLSAYYDCSCDSHKLFENREIARTETYEQYLNQYNVINLDISGFISEVKKEKGTIQDIPILIEKSIRKDLAGLGYPCKDDDTLNECLIHCAESERGRRFIFIIDEWDAVIREARNDKSAQETYLNLLRGWFKNTNFTPRAVAAAYMTGILPIKKNESQSAISDFLEYSILNPMEFAEFTGFTEKEVSERCAETDLDFQEVKAWYNGYDFPKVGAIYNPYSVINALRYRKCGSYWKQTSTAESLKTYISMDFKGLQSIVAGLISGGTRAVIVDEFQNDFETFESVDDVLTLLIHLGYLAYREKDGTVRIPNEEVRKEFELFLTKKNLNSKWLELLNRSQKLLDDTLDGDHNAVEKALEQIRGEQYAPQYYNNEQALRAVIKYAYIAAIGQYVKIEEMPSGRGIADVVYIPLPYSNLPAMVVELKWNKSSGGAIEQIKEKRYTDALEPFAGNILLVGVGYSEKKREAYMLD